MTVQLDELQLKALIAMRGMPEKERSYVEIANRLDIKPHKLRRSMEPLIEEGVYFMTASGRPSFTDEGQKMIDKLIKYKKRVRDFLIYKGMEKEAAEAHADRMVLFAESDFYDKIIDQPNKVSIMKSKFNSGAEFTGAELTEIVKNFKFERMFELLKYDQRRFQEYSMANRGFYKPCTVLIKNGKGTVIFKRKSMSAQIPSDHTDIMGYANSFQYFDGNEFVEADRKDDPFSIPLDKFHFYTIGENDDTKILKGVIYLRFNCATFDHSRQSKEPFASLVIYIN